MHMSGATRLRFSANQSSGHRAVLCTSQPLRLSAQCIGAGDPLTSGIAGTCGLRRSTMRPTPRRMSSAPFHPLRAPSPHRPCAQSRRTHTHVDAARAHAHRTGRRRGGRRWAQFGGCVRCAAVSSSCAKRATKMPSCSSVSPTRRWHSKAPCSRCDHWMRTAVVAK